MSMGDPPRTSALEEPSDEPEVDGPEPEFEENFDSIGHMQKSRSGSQSPKLFLALLVSAARLSREASPRVANVNIALQIATVVLLGLQVLFGKLALEAILEQARDGGSFGAVIAPLIGVVAATGLAGLASSAQVQLRRLLGETVQKTVMERILGVTTAVSLETFESPAFHDDLQRVRANAVQQPTNLSQALVGIFGGGAGVLVLAIVLFFIHPVLVPVLLVAGVPQALLSRKSGAIEFAFRVAETPDFRVRDYLQRVLSEREEAKEIRAFDLGDVLFRRWDTNFATYLTHLRHHVRRRFRLALFASLLTFVATGTSLGLLVWLVIEGHVALASAGAALIAIRLLATRVEMMLNGVSTLFECSLFLRDYDHFLDRGREVAEHPSGSGDADTVVEPFEELVADNVSFRYPQSRRNVLHGVSMRIRAGEVVALVGENGSGKTTLAKLLCHVFSPTGGRITWDGTDVAGLPPAGVRRNIGVIFQDFVRYQLSARENVGFGRADGIDDHAGITEAAERAGADAFLQRLPQGYDTLLGKSFWGGVDLSLGQWQRVAIARAFFRGAGFLVLDEPTASLDARSEHRLFEQMQELAHGRALLLISHRFSTVRSADRIYVLHQGEVVEEGDHDQLMALGGRYAELFTLQANSYQ